MGDEAGRKRAAVQVAAVAFMLISSVVPAFAGGPPQIRSTATNAVPECVTPERLMAFIAQRNDHLAPKFSTIAEAYRDLGQAWQVRWDYAFFQMVLETNYLKFQRGDGSSGDVGLAQNNFAGVGATGGGVPGDKFPDVRTGVVAHIQHLVAYSGEHVEQPVARRTREFQGDIIEISRKLGRPVTFGDLSHRWAADRGYGKNIETVAELFRKSQCNGTAAVRMQQAMVPPNKLGAPVPTEELAPPVPVEAVRKAPLVRTIWRRGDSEQAPVGPVPRPVEVHKPVAAVPAVAVLAPEATAPAPEATAQAGAAVVPADAVQGVARFAVVAKVAVAAAGSMPAKPCRISYAGAADGETVLITTQGAAEMRLTVVGAGEGEGQAAAEQYIAESRSSAEVAGLFANREAAVAKARTICPGN